MLPLEPPPARQGVLNLHKPAGVTSRQIVDQVEWLVRPAKAGHAGTLDPLATGVLVVGVGRATRLVSALQACHKTYQATFVLGQTSDTDDVTGRITPLPEARVPTREEIERELPQFRGEFEQVPPQFSAVHVGGRRAYDLARHGKAVDLAPRRVTVYRLEILDYAYPELRLEIECSSGTYIRALGRDLGRRLGTGGVMSALVRTRIGPFDLAHAVAPEQLTQETLDQYLQPLLAAVADWPRYLCTEDEARRLRCGQTLRIPEDRPAMQPGPGGEFALVCPDGTLLGMGKPTPDGTGLHPTLIVG